MRRAGAERASLMRIFLLPLTDRLLASDQKAQRDFLYRDNRFFDECLS
jgi:hypothetical protein